MLLLSFLFVTNVPVLQCRAEGRIAPAGLAQESSSAAATMVSSVLKASSWISHCAWHTSVAASNMRELRLIVPFPFATWITAATSVSWGSCMISRGSNRCVMKGERSKSLCVTRTGLAGTYPNFPNPDRPCRKTFFLV